MTDIATTPTEVTIPPTPVKPGIHTSEFWLGLATKLLGGAYATGLIGDGTTAARIAGLAVVVLAYFGYTVTRGLVKSAAAANGNTISAFDPIATPSSTSSEAKSAASAVPLLMLVLLVGAGGAALTSCATVRPVATTAVAAELDCTSAQIAATVNALAQPAKDYLLGKISGDGRTVDTAALRADARALKSQAWTCALSTAFALLLQPPAASAGFSARVEPGGPDPDVLRAAWAELRGELGVGRVVTSAGAI